MRVLIADDDFITRKTISSMIALIGFDCCVENDGKSALNTLLSSDSPPIAVLDWQMPGMDGIDIIKELRKQRNDYIYCILLTGRSEPEDIEAGFAAGADDFIIKPANLSSINHRLNVARRIMEYDIKTKSMQNELNNYAVSMKELAEERARQLIHADRLATLGTLSAGLAHEINNPATYIVGNVQIMKKSWQRLLEKIDIPEDTQSQYILNEFPKMLDDISSGIERITKIVASLKQYYKNNSSGRKILFNINEAIEESLEICRSRLSKNIRIEKILAEDLPDIKGEKNQIEQVIINLINNALDAMEKKSDKKLEIISEQKNDSIWFYLYDNGSGIPRNIMSKLFNPFFSTKGSQNGTGLGLSISKSIIEGHGGELKCISLDNGTCFYFSIPYNRTDTKEKT